MKNADGTGRSEKTSMEWETVRRLRGVNAVAKRIGYSHTHIIRVMRGERTASRELAAKLRKLGVEVPEVPAAQ